MLDRQSRRFQLTINNPEPNYSHDKIREISSLKFKTFQYLAMADEIGKEGTPHVHIFLCFKSAVRFSTVKKQFVTAHIEIAKGSIEENINYIKKTGKWANTEKAETSVQGTFEELGERPQENAGGKNELYSTLYRMVVEEGLSDAEIIRSNNDLIGMIDVITRLRTTMLRDKFKGTRRTELQTVFVQGVTGAGKSRAILDEFGDDNCYRVTDYTHPFDMYQIEDVLVFEEFRSNLPISDMLNYLDIYPLTLPARYAQKQACYTKIFITTNMPLEDQYKELQRTNPESWQAFLRRIHKVRVYTDIGVYTDYDSVEAYFNRTTDFEHVNEKDIPFD